MQAPDRGPSLSHLAQVALPVQDLERAIGFYRDVLRVPFLFRTPSLAFFDCSGVRLMLSAPEEGQEPASGSILYFLVPQIGRAWAELTGKGVDFIDAPHLIARMPDHELWMTFFHDGEGNTLALMCEIRDGA